MTCRPGPKSGTRRGKSNRFRDQNNTRSSRCAGSRPIRKVRGKPPTGYAVNNTSAEALHSYIRRGVSIQLTLDSTLCVPLLGHMPPGVPFSSHMLFFLFSNLWLCT